MHSPEGHGQSLSQLFTKPIFRPAHIQNNQLTQSLSLHPPPLPIWLLIASSICYDTDFSLCYKSMPLTIPRSSMNVQTRPWLAQQEWFRILYFSFVSQEWHKFRKKKVVAYDESFPMWGIIAWYYTSVHLVGKNNITVHFTFKLKFIQNIT